MKVEEFLESIYLGDRACKKIILDSWNKEFCIEVDNISRIRSPDKNWNYYTAEDIENGQIVFININKVIFDGRGMLPNDQINYLQVSGFESNLYKFEFSVDSVEDDLGGAEIKIIIFAESVALRDPSLGDALIVD